jgi:hypothetical protein
LREDIQRYITRTIAKIESEKAQAIALK